MLKSCHYCGRIHDKKYVCPQKEEAIKRRQKKKGTKEDKFRSSSEWKWKREDIRIRDRQICQLCVRGLYTAEKEIQTEGIEVHHIVPIEEDWDRRMDGENLITLCRYHHEMAEKEQIKRVILKKIAKEQEERENYTGIG